jgi:hypothetical protein
MNRLNSCGECFWFDSDGDDNGNDTDVGTCHYNPITANGWPRSEEQFGCSKWKDRDY